MSAYRFLLMACLFATSGAVAEIRTVVDHNDPSQASPAFKFKNLPSPARNDLGTQAKPTLVDGTRDANSAPLRALNDGRVPSEEDQPEENFFFGAGTPGGRLQMDLGKSVELKQINTYSWHAAERGPQVYKLYASDGQATGFNPKPTRGTDPEKCGWKLLANVDTRPKNGGELGGQYAASTFNSDGTLGSYRYLLFDIVPTATGPFGNTFYSEIDVLEQNGEPALPALAAGGPQASSGPLFVTHSTDGACEITIDTSAAPTLKDWAEQKLAPVLAEWYPKIVTLLTNDGFNPPKRFSVQLKPDDGVAYTAGTRIVANSDWLSRELSGEAVGALVHEEVHVVQQYWRPRRDGTNSPHARPPGWLVEGIPDYIRWFQYEPQSHGADITWLRARKHLTLSYDAKYRVTANFLNYAAEHYGVDLITKLNAACRLGTYSDNLWKEATGKTIEQLNDEWKAATEQQLAAKPAAPEAPCNLLTDAEKAAGWQLLFNGQDFSGWHNFKHDGVRPGWQVKDGTLVCADPHQAGDIVTAQQFDWFELQLDYNISVAGNSGIMYHVTDQGGAAWATGPEFQLEDNKEAHDPIRCGWLYALYQPPVDPKTGKTLDATKPAGEWNHVRLLISPTKCEHEINGVKYFEYVLGSEDFKQRVAQSKFSRMPHFAKSATGSIALQGDHGQVMFRNIKIRPLKKTAETQ